MTQARDRGAICCYNTCGMKTVLIIDDEKDIVEAIGYNLEKEGFEVTKAYDGLTGLNSAIDRSPDIILLDLMLPLMSGTEICKSLKANSKTADIPIIMLTAKSEETDKVVGLEIGADDYITKPFGMKELIARVKAVLKRYGTKHEAKMILKFPDLEIDGSSRVVKASGKSIELTAKEFDLLAFLAKNKEIAFERERLLDLVWGIDVAVETRTVDVHIRRLREKLGKASRHLMTLHGVGYKFSVNE